ncbi:hypothetical protein KSP39_PZI014836 [Platanthera zijinensis]|uniref:Uncharacterized protein n=1 Tax=Platanthera zijinensis TaxID=2320716 RepID=A0AAP0G2Q5_9ASPA
MKLSLGDARAYYLSTAKNELGVVSAQSIAATPGYKYPGKGGGRPAPPSGAESEWFSPLFWLI